MKSLIILAALAAFACAGEQTPDHAAHSAPAASAPPASSGAVRFPDGAFKLTCGPDKYDIHFTDQEAHVTPPGGGFLTLKRLPPGQGAADVATYTDGRLTFARSAGPGETTRIAFARGRMATQDCVVTAG